MKTYTFQDDTYFDDGWCFECYNLVEPRVGYTPPCHSHIEMYEQVLRKEGFLPEGEHLYENEDEYLRLLNILEIRVEVVGRD